MSFKVIIYDCHSNHCNLSLLCHKYIINDHFNMISVILNTEISVKYIHGSLVRIQDRLRLCSTLLILFIGQIKITHSLFGLLVHN